MGTNAHHQARNGFKAFGQYFGWQQQLIPEWPAPCLRRKVALSIAVIDYGMGNLRSVSKALEQVVGNVPVVVTHDPAVVAKAERVFPGQGAMPDCTRELADRNLVASGA